jgi:hypothetical protein
MWTGWTSQDRLSKEEVATLLSEPRHRRPMEPPRSFLLYPSSLSSFSSPSRTPPHVIAVQAARLLQLRHDAVDSGLMPIS